MCIILTCEKFVRPDYELVETCFYNNPDGAGLMWVEDGLVQLSKGYTDPQTLFGAIESIPKDSRLVIHMRIATSGGIDVGTCHPFPICSELELLHAPDVECPVAIAHNGVIRGIPTDDKLGISDTVAFVATTVNDLYEEAGGITKSVCRKVKRAAPNNRFAIMTSDGEVHRLGTGWESVARGIEASNDTWRFDLFSKWSYSWSHEDNQWKYVENIHRDDPYDFYGSDNELVESVFDTCCGNCTSIGSCISYGALCDDVAAIVEEVMADRELVVG